MERLKKIGLVLLFLAVTFGVGFMLYRFFFAPGPSTSVPAGEEPAPGEEVPGLTPSGDFVPGEEPPFGAGDEFPSGLVPSGSSEIASGGLTVVENVSEFSVMAPALSSSGTLTYYDTNDGKFYSIGPNGEPRLLSNKVFPQADTITWSPGTEKAIIEFPDESKVIYDFENEKQITLPNHWDDFSFAEDGESFAAKTLGLDPENRWLITVNADGSNAKLIEHLGDNADKVTVKISPDDAVIAISETGDPVGFDTKEVILIGPNNENYKAMRIEGFNFEPIWSPTGEHLLYSTASSISGYRPMLWFSSAKGDSIGAGRTNLGIQTWAHKCTFADATTVFCAVPDSLPEGIGLQPSLQEGGSDTVFRIDLAAGRTDIVGKPDGDINVDSLVLSGNGDTLFMRDVRSGVLKSMKLR